jgi:thymidylate synthase
MQIMRSNDLFRGLPHNIVQFTSLQEVMSGWLGLELGGYHQISDSLHIYERDLGNVKGRTAVTTLHNRDSLMLNKAESDRVWRDIEERMEALLVQRLTGPAWHSIADFDGPQPFQNLFAVVLADDARRRAWPEVALQAISKCTNPVLRQLWENWTVRNEKGSTK